MNLKVIYGSTVVDEEEVTLIGRLQSFIAVGDSIKGILIVGKSFISVPIEDIVIEKTLI